MPEDTDVSGQPTLIRTFFGPTVGWKNIPEADFTLGDFINVKDSPYFAVGDGATDDSVAVQAAVDAAQAALGGIVFFPAGRYMVPDGIVVEGDVTITLAGPGRSQAFIDVGDANVVAIDIQQADFALIRDLTIIGSHSFAADKPALWIENPAGEVIIERCNLGGGQHTLLIEAGDTIFRDLTCSGAYGSAVVKSAHSGGHNLYHCKMDQNYVAGGAPGAGFTYVNWAAATAYVVGDIRVITAAMSGFAGDNLIQCNDAGTSGGTAPVLQPYGTDMPDGTAVWQFLAPREYYGYQMDTGASENALIQCDSNGPYTSSYAFTNSEAGDAPSLCGFYRCGAGNAIKHSFDIGMGSGVTIQQCGFGSGRFSTGGILSAGIRVHGTYEAGLLVTNNYFVGSGTQVGISLEAGENTIITSNQFSGGFTKCVQVAAGMIFFTINSNISTAGGIDVAVGASDHYIITSNQVHGEGVTDGGTGVDKVVADNI